MRTIIIRKTFVFITICSVLAASCNLIKEDPCTPTDTPLDEHNLITGSSNMTYQENVVYRHPVSYEIFYITGDCDAITHHWEVPENSFFVGAENEAMVTLQHEHSGALCAQLSSEDSKSAKVCRNVNVLRNNVWGFTPDPFPGANTRYKISMTVNGKAYTGLGDASDWFAFDTLTWKWEPKASIPNLVNFSSYGGFSLNGKGYIVGNNSKVYEYDPTTNQWTTKNDFPVLVNDILGLSFRDDITVAGASANGKGYFGIGYTGRFFEYDAPTDTWTEKAPYPVTDERRMHTFGLADKIYAGQYAYDPASNTWASVNFNFKLVSNPGVAVIGDKAYFVHEGKTKSYDPSNGKTEIVSPADRQVFTTMFPAPAAVTGNMAFFVPVENDVNKRHYTYYYIVK
jgi:hypothetical protein